MNRLVLLCLLAACLLVASCDRTSDHGRVMVIGLDGLDPQTVELLIDEGKLPNLARLRRDGAYGHLESQKPLLSPVVWTTIATGKTPDQHGIGHFIAIDPSSGESLPVTSEMRRVKALWNILSDSDRTVGVVGWWATWPAEKINGQVVSDHTCYHFLFPQVANGSQETAGITYPPELMARLEPQIRRPGDVGADEVAPFLHVTAAELDRPFDFDDDVSHFRWALATAATYRAIGLDLWRRERPDVLLVYTEATDSVAHLFGHLFRVRGLAGELAEQQRKFGLAVEQTYVYADQLVGEYIDAMDERTTLVVLSDHGFELGAMQNDPSKTRDMRRVSERFHRIDGVLFLYGRGIRPGAIEGAHILDIAPTVLALTGVGAADDMPGRVLHEVLLDAPPGRAVASYEDAKGPDDEPTREAASVDAGIRRRLESLGYLGDTATEVTAARSPQGERNLAAMAFDAGRFEESVAIYERLLTESADDGSLHASLGGALAALGRFDDALAHLHRAVELDPLNVGAYHNRAAILERQGQTDAAIALYREALRYRPDYEPSRSSLVRLTGSGEVRVARSVEQSRALELAQRASLAARRGDYDGAMRLLDEAESIASDVVVVHQYRSNVAYLSGDVDAAIAALERAVELEPGNALFLQNLEHLRRESSQR